MQHVPAPQTMEIKAEFVWTILLRGIIDAHEKRLSKIGWLNCFCGGVFGFMLNAKFYPF